ncbi:P-loop containing nucleoside triphosphate hydrolase protein [Auricularia subglabra TFB-10046 SS5]|nr:P-loop containing nucleoside triphosphate hydrolase protein [Auricularia subglabra TFB-10046 SS5]
MERLLDPSHAGKGLAALAHRPRGGRQAHGDVCALPYGAEPESSQSTGSLHHTQREILDELVEAARQHSMEGARHYVSVHLADQHGAWTQVVHKARRRLDTLVLPEGTSELLLRDAREFIASEAWYKSAGVPYRRGYLLHGIPGAGKTSTIHAMASELMLPIYAVSLANKGLDDSSLHALVAQTPAECILSIEDIDCAFPEPRRAEDEDEEGGEGGPGMEGGARMEAMGPRTMQMNAMGMPVKSSEVTLSGLLNVIDGVWSEEGRLVFATTNHIEKLDPALLRPGRMDVKIQYSATTRDQARRLFVRFFPPGDSEDENAKISELAEQFSGALPEDTFSAAALQGYLLLWKNNPSGAAENVGELVEAHKKEEAERAAAKEKERAARRRWLEARKKVQSEANNSAGANELPKAEEAVGGTMH